MRKMPEFTLSTLPIFGGFIERPSKEDKSEETILRKLNDFSKKIILSKP